MCAGAHAALSVETEQQLMPPLILLRAARAQIELGCHMLQGGESHGDSPVCCSQSLADLTAHTSLVDAPRSFSTVSVRRIIRVMDFLMSKQSLGCG